MEVILTRFRKLFGCPKLPHCQYLLDYYIALTAELKKDGINIKDAAEILGVPRSLSILVIVRVTKHLNLSRTMYLTKNYPQQSKWPVTAIPFMAIAVFALYSDANLT
jgi:hypothetical protein